MISFIIPNRNGKNLKDVINNINTIYNEYDKEILVINQCDTEPFKRGQILNIGLKECNGDWVALCDNDIIHFTKINLFDEYQKNNDSPYLGFKYITQIQIDENGDYVKQEKVLNETGAGAFLFGKKEDFIKVNGYSNLYIGWGCEDNEISCRLCNNNNSRPTLKHLDQELGHITHPKRTIENEFKRNQKIFFSRKERNSKLDGINQIIYNKVNECTIDNVRYIDVDSITVVPNFKYINLL